MSSRQSDWRMATLGLTYLCAALWLFVAHVRFEMRQWGAARLAEAGEWPPDGRDGPEDPLLKGTRFYPPAEMHFVFGTLCLGLLPPLRALAMPLGRRCYRKLSGFEAACILVVLTGAIRLARTASAGMVLQFLLGWIVPANLSILATTPDPRPHGVREILPAPPGPMWVWLVIAAFVSVLASAALTAIVVRRNVRIIARMTARS